MTLKEQFLDKKVRVTGVRVQTEKHPTTIVGIVSFIGRNELLNKKQVTLSRMPIFLDSFDQVQLYTE